MNNNEPKSGDPRVNRLNPWVYQGTYADTGELDQWQNYEVFAQKNRGEHAIHLGSAHAPNPEMAVVLAKEQYTRRMKCHSLWVVKTADIFVTPPEDEDMFEPGLDKNYRESFGYKNREVIENYKKQQPQTVAANSAPASTDPPKKRPVIIVGKK